MRAGLALGLGIGLGLAWLLAARRRRRAVREVLFFPSRPCCTEELLAEAEGRDGRPAPCPCPLPRSDCSLSRLLRRLLAARRSLELCLFAFSSPELGRAVCVLHRRGVRVRVVTDSQYMALKGSQIGVLRLLGIQVRHNQDVAFMHHKFAIVDKKLLITGSLNWTMEAIHSNQENVVIMEDMEYVQPFLDEFERIWEECNPSNYTFFSQRK
ncbi:mitochondrial cardiolipin hydrolase [Lagopus leucura]|uniref:mitochondrial cardiolipin hydrolase n=1 Tax=Lagopus leucura TaxID=30410 RepID=UPI001C665D63|nr:mitochondrial cardiolipin hydrolase [Lagopus leucura]